MTNISVIENKVSLIKKYLKILQRYQKYSKEKIVKDIDIKGAAERYLYLVVQATIDLAGAIISFRNFRKPTTMSENFYILNEEKIINSDLTETLVKMTGFRNIIVHDYEEINYDVVYDVLKNRLKDIEKFLKIVEGMRMSE
ncbi:DUF86 domain-containing protein [Candidatus Parcubacteria bacterium]|nr:DUF86 domain-containing protein [Patescibacteria group bacterium]MCG2686764.1 DUF86 domain-containing protein [Candidatus Parcubacteria bacterium]